MLTVNRNLPSWLISTQQGAICWSGNGNDPIDERIPSAESWNGDTVPLSGAVLWAFDTNS